MLSFVPRRFRPHDVGDYFLALVSSQEHCETQSFEDCFLVVALEGLFHCACVYAVHVLGFSVKSGPRVFVSKRNSGSRGVCRLGQDDRVRVPAWMSTLYRDGTVQ